MLDENAMWLLANFRPSTMTMPLLVYEMLLAGIVLLLVSVLVLFVGAFLLFVDALFVGVVLMF